MKIELEYAQARKNDLVRMNAERGVKDLSGDVIDLNRPVARGLATGVQHVASGVEFTDPEGKKNKGQVPE